MWNTLGFSKSPYDANPLKPIEADADLLIGRVEEGIEFATLIESADNGTILLSGLPGVGKTSFFNVQQYLMESGKAPFGKKIVAARHLCPIQSGDNNRDIALRVLHNTCRNLAAYCEVYNSPIPPKVAEVFEWLNGSLGSGFNFSLSLAGFGGGFGKEKQLPAPRDASFEVLQIILSSLIEEITSHYGLDGIFVALDNIENLEDSDLSSMLMAFRDTFFTVDKVWWIVIGQTGLSSLVQVLDPRVAERMTGDIELTPISSEELHTAIDRRVARFHRSGTGKAPLPQEIHDFLYDASLGEIRFVFKYSSHICTKFVSETRAQIVKLHGDLASVQNIIDEVISNYMVNEQIPSEHAMAILKKMIQQDIQALVLRPKEREVLARIGISNRATQSDHKAYGVKTGQDFSSNYLSKLHKSHLLAKSQEGRRVYYSLRGIAAIAARFDLFSEPPRT